MNAIALFGRVHLLKLRHFLFPVRLKTYFPLVSLIAIGVGVLWLEYAGFMKVFGYMNQLPDFTRAFIQFLLERFFGLIFLVSYSMIFMSSMVNGLSSYFLSRDLPFLYSLPVPRPKILIAKFLECWATSIYLIVMFLVFFLLAYANSYDVPVRRYPVYLAALLLFTLSPVAAGNAVLVVLIRFFPVRKIHQIVTMIGGVFLGALMIALRMMRPERLFKPSETDDFAQLIQDLTVPSFSHLPSSWVASAMINAEAMPFLKLLIFTVVVMALAALVFRILYDRAYVNSQESRDLRAKPLARRKESRFSTGKTSAVIIKDLKLFLRDATQWSQLLLLGALVIVYLLNIKNLAIQLPMVRWVVSFINLGLAGFVLSALSVRFLFPSVSIEGRAFWIIKTLPISIRRLLWSKFLIYFPPFLLFTETLVFFSNRILEVPGFFIGLSALNILAVSFALTGLAIGIGALMPNFKSDNPSQIAVGPGGVLYMFLSLAYIGAMLMIQLRPVWYFAIKADDRFPQIAYVLAAILLTAIVGLIPMEIGSRRLQRQEYY